MAECRMHSRLLKCNATSATMNNTMRALVKGLKQAREVHVRQQTARQGSGLWAYTKAQAKGDDKAGGSADRSIRRNTEGERSVKIPRDRCETLRAIIRQEDHAVDKAGVIERALDDLGGNNDPARMILGMAATLWNETVGANSCKHCGSCARIGFQRGGRQ